MELAGRGIFVGSVGVEMSEEQPQIVAQSAHGPEYDILQQHTFLFYLP